MSQRHNLTVLDRVEEAGPADEQLVADFTGRLDDHVGRFLGRPQADRWVGDRQLGAILVSGENGFRPGFIESRMRPGAGPPMDVNRLQEQMQLLLQNPQIERLNAEHGAGTRPGDAVLRMDVTEAPRGTYGLAFANNRSPAIGSNRAEASVAYRNPLGLGDAIGARFGYGTGIKD